MFIRSHVWLKYIHLRRTPFASSVLIVKKPSSRHLATRTMPMLCAFRMALVAAFAWALASADRATGTDDSEMQERLGAWGLVTACLGVRGRWARSAASRQQGRQCKLI